jgi:UDP-perosamine 4-acetyltransferase
MIGGGGHAKVLLNLIRSLELEILGVCDPALVAMKESLWLDLKVLGGDDFIENCAPDSVGLVLGVGQTVHSFSRARIFADWRSRGYFFPTLVHPSALIADYVDLEHGVQVMSGCVLQTCTTLGANSIVNTGSTIDHDCIIGSNVHIAPGVTLCGSVVVEDGAFIGAGSVVIQGLRVGANAVVGAGVTLTRNLGSGETVVGASNRFRKTPPGRM